MTQKLASIDSILPTALSSFKSAAAIESSIADYELPDVVNSSETVTMNSLS